ncbi:MAG: hypothetical protein V3T77_06925 [Planctomycetota bacterium]
MQAECTHSTTELIHQLLRIHHDAYTGTVRVETPGEGVCICLRDGHVFDVLPDAAPSLLERALLAAPILKERERRKIRKQAAKENRDPGEIVLERNLLIEDDVTALLQVAINEMLSPIFCESHVAMELWTELEESSYILGISRHVDLLLTMEHVLFGVARSLESWDLVKEALPLLKDVYYATPQIFSIMEKRDEYPWEVRLIECLDGLADLRQIIDQSEVEPFQALEVIQALHQDGYIELVSPVQLFQLAADFVKQDQLEKAIRLYERAEERGLEGFAVRSKLAELYLQVDRDEDAVHSLLTFAERAEGELRGEEAMRALGRIIEIDPDNLEVQERHLSLLCEHSRHEAALERGLMLARTLDEGGYQERAKEILKKVVELEANEEVLRLYLELCQRTKDHDGAHGVRKVLAEVFDKREENEKALELYQRLFVNGEDTPEVRSRLTELHLLAGNPEKAREHLMALQEAPGWAAQDPVPEAVQLYRRILELDPKEPSISGWLLEEARARGERSEVLKLLALHRNRLEAAGNLSEARRFAEMLTRLSPLDLDAVRSFISLEKSCGILRRASQVLEKVAEKLEEQGGARPEHQELLETLLEANPLSLLGRRLLLPLYQQKGDSVHQHRLMLELSLLELVAGNCEEAGEFLKNMEQHDAIAPVFALLAGHFTFWRGDAEKARECFFKCARLSGERGDRGLLEEVIQVLEQHAPDDPEVVRYAQILKDLPNTADLKAQRAQHFRKGSVKGIISRLRSMNDPAPAAAHVKREALTSVKRLKAVKQKDKDAPPPAPVLKKTASLEPNQKSMGSSAERLRALKAPPPSDPEKKPDKKHP